MDTVVTGPLQVLLWSSGETVKMAPVTAEQAAVDDVAAWLAAASGSPRYDGQRWPLLLESEANVTHAFACALKRGSVDPAQLRDWRDRLTSWHQAPGPPRHGFARDTPKVTRQAPSDR